MKRKGEEKSTIEKEKKKTKKDEPVEEIEESTPIVEETGKKNKVKPRPKNRVKEGKEMVLHPALQYLEDFANKNNWKFNKGHQSWILENVLNKKHIPKEYFKYSLEYLEGLKGAARDRLIKDCDQAMEAQVEKEKDDLSDPEDAKGLEEKLAENTRYKRAQVIAQLLTIEEGEK
jgi:hypothetical protein